MGDWKANKLFQEGKKYALLGKQKKAIKLYKKAIFASPDHVESWISLSKAYFELEKYEDVIDASKSLLKIDMKNHLAWINMGSACFQLGKYEKAIKAYNEALKIKPDHRVATKNLKIVQKKMNEKPSEVTPPSVQQEKEPKEQKIKKEKSVVEVLRGGDWKVEGNQSIFYYKVKINNDTEFVISNIQVLLTSIPAGLESNNTLYRIETLKPDSFESPTFKLSAKESCVGDTVEGIVTYTDHRGTQQSIHIEPFEICYVCNLLTPKEITKEEFDRKVNFMQERKLVLDSDLNVPDLEAKIEQIVRDCNFALLQDLKAAQDENFMKVEAFAEGLYDKQDVALSVAVQKVENGSQLVVKAMSDRSEKVTDLLRDFSIKLDDIKSDTELIKEYTSQIETILDNQENMEAYLKDHLGSDFEKIKDAWQDYKEGKINKKQLIGQGIKVIGKKFIKKMLEKVSPI
ncbi:MAG: tetratricopeptide repeat protein [Promethearchaeota archaeon]